MPPGDLDPVGDDDLDDLFALGPAGKTTRAPARTLSPEPDQAPAPADEPADPPSRFGLGRIPKAPKQQTAPIIPGAPQATSTAKRRFAFGAAGAGGRKGLLLLRLGIWVVLGVVALAGLRTLLMPPKVDVDQIVAEVGTQYGLTTAPQTKAADIAARFATLYLTYDPAAPEARTAAIAALTAPGIENVGSEIAGAENGQVIVAGPFLDNEPAVDADGRVTVAMTAAVAAVPSSAPEDPQKPRDSLPPPTLANSRWITLEVPVITDPDGGVSIAGAPAFVPPPLGAPGGKPYDLTVDKEAEGPLTASLQGFFTAWAASDKEALARYLLPDPSVSASAGMNGLVKFQGISGVRVQAGGVGEQRYAEAIVDWDYQGVTLRQAYALLVVQGDGDLWFVADVAGGNFG